MSETPTVGDRAILSIRAERARLLAQELRVSYWRSLAEARLDELTKGRARVARPMGRPPARGARVEAPVPAEGDDHAPHAMMWRVWAEVVDRADPRAVAAAVATLTALERSLSADRAVLHRRIDAVTAELIASYRRDPLAALDALPDPR